MIAKFCMTFIGLTLSAKCRLHNFAEISLLAETKYNGGKTLVRKKEEFALPSHRAVACIATSYCLGVSR